MVGVLVVGFLANLMVTDVHRRHFDHDSTPNAKTSPAPDPDTVSEGARR